MRQISGAKYARRGVRQHNKHRSFLSLHLEMPSEPISVLLRGGDRRSIGRSNQVARLALRSPRRFAELIRCMWSDDAIVRMRAADAAEKVSVILPELLKPYKSELLGLLVETEQIELRWHLAQMVSRLPLTKAESLRAAQTLQHYLGDRSSIVRTFALQALADISRSNPELRSQVTKILRESVVRGTAAMKARARRLLKERKS